MLVLQKFALALQWLKESNTHYVDLIKNDIYSLNQPSYMLTISDVMFNLEPFVTTPLDTTLIYTNITKRLKTERGMALQNTDYDNVG